MIGLGLAIRSRRSGQAIVAALAAALAAAHSTAMAQNSITAGIGAAVPIGSSADLLNPGYTALLSLAIQPHWMRRPLRFDGAWNALSERSPASAKREVLSATANMIFAGEPASTPSGYVIIGAGYYQTSGGMSARRSDPGFNVGAGVRFSMGFFGTFLEARLHCVADDPKTKYFPIAFGLTF